MEFNFKYLFFIICIINIIKTSYIWNNSSNAAKGQNLRIDQTKRNIQYVADSSEIIANSYNINIFELYSFHDNQLDFVLFYKPQIKEDISFWLTLEINIINKTGEYYEYPKFEIKINSKNISNIYTLNLENFDIINYTEIAIRDLLIPNNKNNYYNINSSTTKIVIINNTKNNDNFIEIVQKPYSIYITAFYAHNNQLSLVTYCEPNPEINITLILKIFIQKYNEASEVIDYFYDDIEIIINNTTNKFNYFLEKLNINGRIDISINQINIEPYNEKNIYYIYYPTSKLSINNEKDEDIIIYPTIKPISISTTYIINITNYSFDNNIINLNIDFKPQKPKNISLLIKLDIFNYNKSKESWGYNYLDVIIPINASKDNFKATLDIENISEISDISISNVYIQHNDWYNKYNIYYTNEGLINSNNYKSDNFNDIKNLNKKSSNKLSGGAVIGIIIAIFVFISLIVAIIVYCICKKLKKKNSVNKEFSKESMNYFTSHTAINNMGIRILKYPKEDMRSFHFETQNQLNIIVEINSNKTIKELRKLFFEKIERKNLIKDKTIYFLYKGKQINFEEKGSIGSYFKDYKELYKILVVDNENKIN